MPLDRLGSPDFRVLDSRMKGYLLLRIRYTSTHTQSITTTFTTTPGTLDDNLSFSSKFDNQEYTMG